MHRERAVLAAARSELIVADATKRVATLGGRPLPLDLDPASIFETVSAIERVADAAVALRTSTGKDGPVLSESGGVLADLEVPDGRTISAELDGLLRAVERRAGHRVLPTQPEATVRRRLTRTRSGGVAATGRWSRLRSGISSAR